MAQEKLIQNAILKEYGATKYMVIWRQNVGLAYGLSQVKAVISAINRFDVSRAKVLAKKLRPIRFGIMGMPDIMGIMNDGRMIGIEVKGPAGRQSTEQKRFQEMMESNGGLYILARSLDDVRIGLQQGGCVGESS